MRKQLILVVQLASLFVSGCGAVKNAMPKMYKINIDQGNIITQEMINQLEPGMNERQVRYVMGTPLMVDEFHKNRWDYLYSTKPGDGGVTTQKRISLYFQDGLLRGVQGDFRPDNQSSFEPNQDATVTVPKIEREKTLGEKIKGMLGFDDEL